MLLGKRWRAWLLRGQGASPGGLPRARRPL